MPRIFLLPKCFLGIVAVVSLFPGNALSQEKETPLGHVSIDGLKAEVSLKWFDGPQAYRVTISVPKPANAPRIKTNRLKIWLLYTDYKKHTNTLPLAYQPPEFFPEVEENGKITAKVCYFFDAYQKTSALDAVVVKLDNKPIAFSLPTRTTPAPFDPEIIAAWEKVGAKVYRGSRFSLRPYYLYRYDDPHGDMKRAPGFSFRKLEGVPQDGLPLPKEPFGLHPLTPKNGKRELAQMPGRYQAKELFLYSYPLEKEGAQELAKLDQLETLVFSSGFAEGSFPFLSRLVHLRRLDLSRTNTTDADLKHLAGLKQLRFLNLHFTKITDKGLKYVGAHPELRVLDLYYNNISDVGIKELEGLEKLRVFSLGKTKITGAALQHLAGLKHLEALSLVESSMDDKDYQALAHLKNLRFLDLSYSKIGNAGMKGVVQLKLLHTLDLDNTKVGDEGCRDLGDLTELRNLYMTETQVGDAAIKEIAKLKKLKELYLHFGKVTDAGLEALSDMKHLTLLQVEGNYISRSAFLELRQALPWTYVH